MNKEELLLLIKAGYNKEEIMKLTEVQEKKPEEQKPEEQKPEEKKPEGDPNDALKSVLDSINKTLLEIQKAAINRESQPEAESAEDILAHFLNGSNNKEEK